MTTSQAGPSTNSNLSRGQNSFFRALSAPVVAVPLVQPEAPLPRVGDPQVPQGLEPLAWPLHTSTGEWAWLNGETFYDIHDLVTLHDDELHTMAIRTCRVGDRTLAYLNKSWKIASRHPGGMSELYLYKIPLNHFMGECVPNLISVRSGPDTFNLGFELPNQTFFIEPSADMPESLKRRTIKALEKLHAQGVCHKALNLNNIMIGADGKIYIYNFHHARYINEKPSLHLLEANEFDFALEMRRLKFKLDYENAREKEKTRLANVVSRERWNDVELKRARDNPLYRLRFIKPARDEKLVPPLDLSRVEAWFNDLNREPRRYLMPGQTAEDFELALQDFYDVLRLMEEEDDKLLTAERQQLKRKRSSGSEEGSPSRKRLRQSPQPPHSSEVATEPKPTEPKTFKNDDHRSRGINLVSTREVHRSIQENNLIPEWPMIIVRDFVKKPPPKTGGRLKALGKRLREEAVKEQEEHEREEKRRVLEEESAAASLGRPWNALRYMYSQHDNMQQEPTHKRTPLRRHETFFYEDPSPNTHNLGTGPSTSTQPRSVHPRPSRIEAGWHDNAFPTQSAAAPLQAIQRLFTELTRPMSL